MSGFSSVRLSCFPSFNLLFCALLTPLKTECLSLILLISAHSPYLFSHLIFIDFYLFISFIPIIAPIFFRLQKPYIHVFLPFYFFTSSTDSRTTMLPLKKTFFLFLFFCLTLLLYGDKVNSNFNSYIRNNVDEEMLLQEILREPVVAANR